MSNDKHMKETVVVNDRRYFEQLKRAIGTVLTPR